MENLSDISDPKYDELWKYLLQPDPAQYKLPFSNEASNGGFFDFDEIQGFLGFPGFPDYGQILTDQAVTQERVGATPVSLMHALDNAPDGLHAPADSFHPFIQTPPMDLHLPKAAPQDASSHW